MNPETKAEPSPVKHGRRFFPETPNILASALIVLVYFLLGKASLSLAFVHPSVTAVWLPSGTALAGFLLLGYRIWPGIFLGAFLVNLATAGTIATSIGIGVGNTFEGLIGAYLVNRFARGWQFADWRADTFRFVFLTGLVSTLVGATVGVTSLSLGGFANSPNLGSIWLTWWLGDGASNVIVAPLLILWSRGTRLHWGRVEIVEAAAMFTALAVVANAVFGGFFTIGNRNYPLEFLCIPLLIGAAIRFGRRGATLGIFILSAIAIRGTLEGYGPFAIGPQDESVLLLDVFLGVLAVMGLGLAVTTREQNLTAEKFRQVVELAPNAIVAVEKKGKIVLVNKQAEKIFGYQRQELIGQSIEVLVPERFRGGHPGHRSAFSATPEARPMGAGRDLYAVRKDGTEFPVEIGLNPVETGQGVLILSEIVDITERKRAEAEIRRLASSDPLTGLANNRRLLEAFRLEAERSGRTGRSFSLLVLDVDGLKKINDTYGHVVGSRALCRMAVVIRQQCRLNDIPARFGGDEFVVILPETEIDGARNLALRSAKQLACDPEQPSMSFSFGVASYPHDGLTFDELLAAADRLLYEGKRTGTHREAPYR